MTISDACADSIVTEPAFGQLRDCRLRDPDAITRAYAQRTRRELAGSDGRLMIIAADHPARGALGIGTDPMAMGDRYELLRRLIIALANPGVDGVLATPDILDDLVLLGALEGKIAIGSMNRGGLRGAAFEIDDRYTGHDVDSIVEARLDAAKVLLRIALEDVATANVLDSTARAVTAAARSRIPILLEPFLSTRAGAGLSNDLRADAVITSIAIASGLGASSAYTWLKLPVVDEMERVMRATTLPALLLGGEGGADRDEMFSTWQHALGLPGVRGLIVGRALLYPPDNDVAGAVGTAVAMVHRSVR